MNLSTRKRRVAGGLAAVAVTTISFVLAATWALADPTSEPDIDSNYAARMSKVAEGTVTAEQLWTETEQAVVCFEANGLRTLGPYPAADGSGVRYSFQATDQSEEIEATCAATANSLSITFSLEQAETGSARDASMDAERDALLHIRGIIESCLAEQGIVIDHSADERDPDEGFAKAAMDQPQSFKACAQAAG